MDEGRVRLELKSEDEREWAEEGCGREDVGERSESA
jgi:hypothetical protein